MDYMHITSITSIYIAPLQVGLLIL